jgi:hypothetical protein
MALSRLEKSIHVDRGFGGEAMVSRIVLGLIVLGMIAVLLTTERRLGATNMSRVAAVATLADDPRLAAVRNYTRIGSGILPYAPGETPPPSGLTPELKLGFSYREFSLFGMPLWAYEEHGFVTYFEEPAGIRIALIGPERVALLEELTGQSYAASYSFPWYRQIWGWWLLIALIGWTLLKRRETRIAEDLHWAS